MPETRSLREEAEEVTGCAIDFLDERGTTYLCYVCGACALIASRGSDGVTYTAEGEWKQFLIDAPDRNYDDIAS